MIPLLMDRRSFIMATTLTGAGGLAIPFLRGQSDSGISKRKLERMAISSSSYRANYDGLNTSIPTVMPRLSHLTFAKYVKERFGITQIELWISSGDSRLTQPRITRSTNVAKLKQPAIPRV